MGAYTARCAAVRAFSEANGGPHHDDWTSEHPRSTWSTTYTDRKDKLNAILDFSQKTDRIGHYDIFFAAFNPDATDACAATFVNLSRALDAGFGPMEEYIVPPDILQRQPYWKPEPKIQIKGLSAFKPNRPVDLHPTAITPLGQSGRAYCKQNGIVVTPASEERLLKAVELLSVADPEDEVVESTVFLVNSQVYDIALQLLGESSESTAGQLRWEQIMNVSFRHCTS